MMREDLDIAYTVVDLVKECFETVQPSSIPIEYTVEQLRRVSKSMGISALTAYALKKRGINDQDFKLTLAQAQRRGLLLDVEYKKISFELQKAQIRHLPMKGIVLTKLYPYVGLREMSDIDIWFDSTRAEDVRNIMTELGYKTIHFDVSKHDVYTKQKLFCIEMHRRFIDTDVIPQSLEYYDNYINKLNNEFKDDEYELYQSREDFYIYQIAHAYKHDLIAGIGVRYLIDVYVMLKKCGDKLDMDYIERESQKLGIADFEKLSRRLALNLFDRNRLRHEDMMKLDGFILAGVSGNMDRYYSNALSARDSKLSYIASRIRMTDRQLADHPMLLKHKILRPLYFPARLAQAIAKRPRMLKTELKTVIKSKKTI